MTNVTLQRNAATRIDTYTVGDVVEAKIKLGGSAYEGLFLVTDYDSLVMLHSYGDYGFIGAEFTKEVFKKGAELVSARLVNVNITIEVNE